MPNFVTFNDLDPVSPITKDDILAIQRQNGDLWEWWKITTPTLAEFIHAHGNYQERIFGDEMHLKSGDSLLYEANSTQRYGYVVRVNTQAIGNEIDCVAYLMKNSTYELRCLGWKAAGGGIISVRLNGTEIGQWDQYAAATTYNDVFVVSGLQMAYTGMHWLSFYMIGKNPSSASYNMRITKATFRGELPE